MNKLTKTILTVIVVVLVMTVCIVVLKNKDNNSNSNSQETKLSYINSEKDLEELIDKVYEDIEENMLPKLQTTSIKVTETDTVKSFTGLDNGNDLEFLTVSEPLMNAQAYSFVLAKVKDGVNANEVAKEMSEKIDTRKWICVEAEKLYATNSGSIVCLVMSDSEKANAIYSSFKKQAGTVGKEYEKTAEVLDDLQ